MSEFFRRHTRTGQHAFALDFCRGRHDHHLVHPRFAAFFKQQRDVESDNRRTGMFEQEFRAHRRNRRMDDGLEPRERLRIAEDLRAQFHAINPVRAG